jgi:hypothetical protein
MTMSLWIVTRIGGYLGLFWGFGEIALGICRILMKGFTDTSLLKVANGPLFFGLAVLILGAPRPLRGVQQAYVPSLRLLAVAETGFVVSALILLAAFLYTKAHWAWNGCLVPLGLSLGLLWPIYKRLTGRP